LIIAHSLTIGLDRHTDSSSGQSSVPVESVKEQQDVVY